MYMAYREKMTERTDQELVTRCKKGDRYAFDALVTRYQEKIYWIIKRMVRNHDDAIDLTQDVFVKAYQKIRSFREDSTVYTWLYRIGINMSLNHLRKRKFRQLLSFDDLSKEVPSKDQTPIQDCEKEEMQQLIINAIERLPEKQKVVFLLRYYEELPYEDISTILGTSVGGLKANYFHAVKKIEAYVKNAL